MLRRDTNDTGLSWTVWLKKFILSFVSLHLALAAPLVTYAAPPRDRGDREERPNRDDEERRRRDNEDRARRDEENRRRRDDEDRARREEEGRRRNEEERARREEEGRRRNEEERARREEEGRRRNEEERARREEEGRRRNEEERARREEEARRREEEGRRNEEARRREEERTRREEEARRREEEGRRNEEARRREEERARREEEERRRREEEARRPGEEERRRREEEARRAEETRRREEERARREEEERRRREEEGRRPGEEERRRREEEARRAEETRRREEERARREEEERRRREEEGRRPGEEERRRREEEARRREEETRRREEERRRTEEDRRREEERRRREEETRRRHAEEIRHREEERERRRTEWEADRRDGDRRRADERRERRRLEAVEARRREMAERERQRRLEDARAREARRLEEERRARLVREAQHDFSRHRRRLPVVDHRPVHDPRRWDHRRDHWVRRGYKPLPPVWPVDLIEIDIPYPIDGIYWDMYDVRQLAFALELLSFKLYALAAQELQASTPWNDQTLSELYDVALAAQAYATAVDTSPNVFNDTLYDLFYLEETIILAARHVLCGPVSAPIRNNFVQLKYYVAELLWQYRLDPSAELFGGTGPTMTSVFMSTDDTIDIVDATALPHPGAPIDNDEILVCENYNFRWSKPHDEYYLDVAAISEDLRADSIMISSPGTNGLRGTNGIAGITTLIVYYADGTESDLITKALNMRDPHIHRLGGLRLLNDTDRIVLPLNPNKAVAGIWIEGDSWLAVDKTVDLSVALMHEGRNPEVRLP